MAAAAEKSQQQEIPGTEVGSAQLRNAHLDLVIAKYEVKAAQERVKAAKAIVEELMPAEGISSISAVIVVNGKNRRATTYREAEYKLRSQLEEGEVEDEPDQHIPPAAAAANVIRGASWANDEEE